MGKPFIHMPANGVVYGKWTVIDDSKPLWKVRCECGQKKEIRRDFILRGLSTGCMSCGQKKHGLEATKVYNAWAAMKQRCLNQNNRFYHLYGGRGIKVCEKWLTFKGFLEDVGKPPNKSSSIGRIDNNGNYEPSNCRWETQKQQIRNRSNTTMIHFEGKSLSAADWADKFDLTPKIIRERLRRGWSVQKSLTAPKNSR
jgi:hypothetical protein